MSESKVKPIAWMTTSNSHGPQFTTDAQMGEHGWKAIGTCYVTRLYSESAIIKLKSKLMAKSVSADLARESKRDAKGVSWDRYQAVCDELESAQYQIEMLEALAEKHLASYDRLIGKLRGMI